MKLTFHGAASEVTGSCFQLVTSKGNQYLIDCGMFQGSRELEDLNYKNFDFNPKNIDALFLTHSHIDHCGLIPKLYKHGFRGKIFATKPTKDICRLLFEDAANLILEKYFKTGEKPMYELEDALGALGLFQTIEYYEEREFNDVKFKAHNSGHILGSAMYEIYVDGKKIVFTGDLGNYPVPMIPKPDVLEEADYILVESTYGGITHEDQSIRLAKFKQAVFNVFNKESVLVIPSFALERTQQIIYELNNMVENGEIVPIPVFVDSPLANKITGVFKNYEYLFDKKTMSIIKSGDDIFKFNGLRMTNTVDESKSINSAQKPKIIIAGSGMCTGGRVLKHLKQYMEDPNNFILFVGYQAEGTIGRKIYNKDKYIKIEDREFKLNAKVDAIGGYSAHIDQPKMIEWLSHFKKKPRKIFVVHGEVDKAEAMAKGINEDLNIETFIPQIGDEVTLD